MSDTNNEVILLSAPKRGRPVGSKTVNFSGKPIGRPKTIITSEDMDKTKIKRKASQLAHYHRKRKLKIAANLVRQTRIIQVNLIMACIRLRIEKDDSLIEYCKKTGKLNLQIKNMSLA